jgi:hypothetical protein
VESLDCDRAEDVTAERLGASRWQVAAFRCAVFSYMLRWPVTERAAIDAVRNRGDWRTMVAEYADEQLDLADRLTGEGDSAAGSPATGARRAAVYAGRRSAARAAGARPRRRLYA